MCEGCTCIDLMEPFKSRFLQTFFEITQKHFVVPDQHCSCFLLCANFLLDLLVDTNHYKQTMAIKYLSIHWRSLVGLNSQQFVQHFVIVSEEEQFKSICTCTKNINNG